MKAKRVFIMLITALLLVLPVNRAAEAEAPESISIVTDEPPQFATGPAIILTGDAAEEADDANETNEADFIAWLNAHRNGGALTLGADVYISGGAVELISDSGEIIINTAGYGIIIGAGAKLSVQGNVSIYGHGAPSPVVRVQGGGSLLFPDVIDVDCAITAADADGVAVYVEAGGTLSSPTASENAQIRLRAEGVNGAALYTEAPVELEGCVFEAPGPGGRGVVSSAPVSLFLCRVRAGAAAVDAQSVVLDTCDVSPSVMGAETVSRTIIPALNLQYILGLLPIGMAEPLPSFSTQITLSAPDETGKSFRIYIRLDVSQVNPSVTGIYTMPVHIPAPFDIAAHNLNEITVEVFESSVPRFYSEGMYSSSFGPSAYCLEYYYTGNTDDLVLWRSGDGGENWSRWWVGAETDEDGFMEDSPVYIEYFESDGYGMMSVYIFNPDIELAGNVWLVFEELSLRRDSRVLFINWDDRSPGGGVSGDRTGVDRVSNDVDGVRRTNQEPPPDGPGSGGGTANDPNDGTRPPDSRFSGGGNIFLHDSEDNGEEPEQEAPPVNPVNEDGPVNDGGEDAGYDGGGHNGSGAPDGAANGGEDSVQAPPVFAGLDNPINPDSPGGGEEAGDDDGGHSESGAPDGAANGEDDSVQATPVFAGLDNPVDSGSPGGGITDNPDSLDNLYSGGENELPANLDNLYPGGENEFFASPGGDIIPVINILGEQANINAPAPVPSDAAVLTDAGAASDMNESGLTILRTDAPEPWRGAPLFTLITASAAALCASGYALLRFRRRAAQ